MQPMANTNRRRSSAKSRFSQLNPAFAAAHGIADAPALGTNTNSDAPDSTEAENKVEATAKESPKKKDAVLPVSASPVRVSPKTNQPSKSGIDKAKQAIGRARASGKLQVSDAGLSSPLPKILFEFPSLVDTVDMSLDSSDNPNKLKSWESHLAETLVLVDFSDNEGITEFPKMDNNTDVGSNHTSTNSVERYRSVQIFRARRCRLKSFSVTTSLAESWPQLTTLDLSGNQLQGEFPLLYLPKTIRELDLSGNRLSSLKSSQDSSTAINLPQLVSLDISQNEIASTGISAVMHLPCLQRINVGHNKIFNLNYILKAISSSEKSLTMLSAPKTLLSDLDGQQPIDLTEFVTLASVDLMGNSLSHVPKIPFTLQRLNVNDNSIKSLEGLLEEDGPGEFMPSSLVVLQLQRNKVTTLDPRIIAKLSQLNRLDLQFNSLQGLPVELGKLTNLQQMFLEGNNLNSLRSSGIRGDLNDTKAILMRLRNRAKKQELASEYETATKATGEGSSYDDTETITSQASSDASTKSTSQRNSASVAEPRSMLLSLLVGTGHNKTLNYEGKHAHMLPFQLQGELESSPDIVLSIDRLNVSKNQIQDIESEWFTLLPHLRTLEAQDNRLVRLPANIRELSFSHINLTRNSLASDAIELSILQPSAKSNLITDTLEVLDLSCNNMHSFPTELLHHFKSLKTLSLSQNRIKSLRNIVDAPCPPSCPSLEHLNLSDNCIEDLGGDDFALMLLVGCPKLQTLKLENNELDKIPMTLGMLEKLKSFDLHGNPQRMIRYEILEKSTSNVLEYMRNRMTSKTKEKANKRLEELRAKLANNGNDSSTFSLNVPPVAPSLTPKVVQNKELIEKGDKPATSAVKTDEPKPPSQAKEADAPTPKKVSDSKQALPPKTPPRKVAPATPTKVGSSRQSNIPTPKSRTGLSPVTLGASTPSPRPRTSVTTPRTRSGRKPSDRASAGKGRLNMTSPLLEELEKSIEVLAADLDKPGISEAKRYAIKKNLAMERSKRLREERRLKQERERSSPRTRPDCILLG